MSNENDPLVEAVARAMQITDGNWTMDGQERTARAAIKAVLEWYSNWENIDDHMLLDLSAADDGKTHAGMRRGVAAAMAAELKRREG